MKSALILATVMMFSIVGNAAQNAKSNRYLVTFKSAQGYAAMNNYLNLESSTSAVKVQNSLKHVKSIVLNAKSAALIAGLKNHPEVMSVEAEKFTPGPRPIFGFKPARMLATQKMRLTEMRSFNSNGTPIFQEGAKTPWGITAIHAGAAWNDSQGGAAARVLVLDTGIDKEHPDIKANFEQGQNFYPDYEGLDPAKFQDNEGHGTHCAGTIAASYNPETGFTGVAPKAKILAGRVCGEMGCSNIAVAEGINWGIEENVDVISMSLGGPMPGAAERLAVGEAERAGVIVVAASGNDGVSSVSYPAAFETPIAVGAVNSSLVKTDFSQWGPELDIVAPGAAVVSTVPRGTGRDSRVSIENGSGKRVVASSAFSGTKLFPTPVANTLVHAGLGKVEDFSNINVEGKFALISRGEIRFSEKVQNAIDAKAAGVVLYNNTAGLMQGALTEDGSEMDFPVVMIEQAEGLAIVEALAQGGQVKAELQTSASDYAMFDGTSMATPHVAGVVALMRSANKKITPAQVREILSTTALAPTGSNANNEYGAGIIQADKAVQAALTIQ